MLIENLLPKNWAQSIKNCTRTPFPTLFDSSSIVYIGDADCVNATRIKSGQIFPHLEGDGKGNFECIYTRCEFFSKGNTLTRELATEQ